MLLAWSLAALFFLGAAAAWVTQIVTWLKSGDWSIMTPVSVLGGTPDIGWVGADMLLSFIYDVNLGLILVVLAVICGELGLFLDSRVAQRVGENLKHALYWPYLIGVSAALVFLIGLGAVYGIDMNSAFDLTELPWFAPAGAYCVFTVLFAVLLRDPLASRLR